MIKTMLLAGCGGFVGTCSRYILTRLTTNLWPCAFPIGTFSVNIIGCLAFGLISGFLQRANIMSEQAGIILLTGFCGGFTTFSAFSADICSLFSKNEWITALLYLSASVILGVLMVLFGRYIVLRSI